MKLNIANELRSPGKAGECALRSQFDGFEFAGRRIEFAAPVTVKARYVYDGIGIDVRGSIETAFVSVCARCGEEFTEPFEANFSERFVKSAEDCRDDCYMFSTDVIDLSDMVIDNILLNMPIAGTCSEDCKGICGVCGINLNTGQCSCSNGG
ncbi:MAG: hypothetical protein BWY11_00857 [Firmicutes bacterium ADurb.Bin182]|nr:MAG: hypothetical protein BWY11_00857 [Firmicutes bacterium ADurb.Bin182]